MDPVNHLRTYDVAELERIAHEQLSKLGSGFTIPPDVDYIIEQLPRVDLDYYPALRDNYGLDGMVCLDLDTGEIKTYNRLKKRTPVNLQELIGVEGLGPKRIKFL